MRTQRWLPLIIRNNAAALEVEYCLITLQHIDGFSILYFFFYFVKRYISLNNICYFVYSLFLRAVDPVEVSYMFVRVERPRGSKRFVLGYVKCDWAFSFALRLEQMRLRLNCIPPVVLTKVEHGENKALRLACVGETDYERDQARYRNENGIRPLVAALRIYFKKKAPRM